VDEFHKLTVTGKVGSLLLGTETAARLGPWTIAAGAGDSWRLSAPVTWRSAFLVRQRGLGFTAPKPGGFWCWPVRSLTFTTDRVVADLGPPHA
jgi:hypothetical protein